MLASLLPGVRQLRAPLAAGFVWLVAGWFAFASVFPSPENATGVIRSLYGLAELAGPTGIAAAAGFIAYVLGFLSVRLTAALMDLWSASATWFGRPVNVGGGLPAPSSKGHAALADVVVRTLQHRSETDSAMMATIEETREICGELRSLDRDGVLERLIDIRFPVDEYEEKVARGLPLIPLRLLVDPNDSETYGEFDRKRAESEFRSAVSLPLAALTVVIAAQTSWWWLLALAVPAAILVDAHSTAVSASDVLAESIRARAGRGAVDSAAKSLSPELEQIRALPLMDRPEWVKHAAQKGYENAMMLWAGQCVDSDEQALWYLRAAEKGNAEAMIWTAHRLHRQGDDLGPEERERFVIQADHWYLRAAARGDPEALAIDELRPALTPAELDDVKSAYAGDEKAMAKAANALLRSGPSAEASTVDMWLQTAARKGDLEARRTLAYLARSRGHDAAAWVIENQA